MPDFANEVAQRSGRVPGGGSISFAFGPASAGPLHVFLSAYEASRRATRVNDGTGPRLVLGRRARPIDVGPTAPGGDEIAPVPPDVEPPRPLDPAVMLVEVFDARGELVGQGETPLMTEVQPRRQFGGDEAVPVAARDTWRVRVTNRSVFDAQVNVSIRFRGIRPVLTQPFELGFINGRFDALFNGPQPIWLRFENRTVGTVPTPQGQQIEIKHTFLVLDALPSWKDAHSDLRDFAVSLKALVLTEVTASTEITLRACVHDGWPAIRVQIRFQPDTGEIDLLNLLSLRYGTLANLAKFIVNVTPLDRPRVTIEQLVLEVFLVLRARPFDAKPTFQVIAQPTLELDSEDASTVGRALAQALFEIEVPKYLGGKLDRYAGTFAGWLLGDRGRPLASGIEQLDIRYVGDAPRPPVVAPTDIAPTAVPLDPGNLSKIDHIVVVMMENRSFDHMLGYLSLPSVATGDVVGRGRADVDGLTGDEFNHAGWLGRNGPHRIGVFPLSRPWEGDSPPSPLQTRPTLFAPNPGYSFEHTKTQRGGFKIELRLPGRNDPSEPNPPIPVTIGANGGFVLDFANRLTGLTDSASLQRRLAGEVMGYHPAEHVPTYDFLAENFTVCDRWFASHPGETWPNRFVSLTGQLAVGPDGLPQLNNPSSETFDPLDTETIFDHLIAAGVSCQYYEHDFCMLRVFERYTFDHDTIAPIDDPRRGFFAAARQGRLPQVSWVEPDLTGLNVGNDDHPPADIMNGQRFIRQVYDALASGPQWNSTLLIITYDEHGGFFDHVRPEDQTLMRSADPLAGGFVPIAQDPATLTPVNYYGMRVPAFVVSPWAPRSISRDVFDHASILKTIIARFLRDSPPDMGWRVAHANHVGPLLSERQPRQTITAPPNPPLASPRVLLRPALRRAHAGDDDFGEFLRRFKDRVLA